MGLTQKDVVLKLKTETSANMKILNKVHPMSTELTRYLNKVSAFDKPTQNLFYHISHYLVPLIDSKSSNSLPWPLYDTKTEREYRMKVSSFIDEYSGKGLLSPVMSSYLVNPSCYKVTVLLFQMSQLAIQRVLELRMRKETQKNQYKIASEKYIAKDEGFIQFVGKDINKISQKFYVHLQKQNIIVEIAELFRTRITEVEKKLDELNAQKYLDNLIDSFFKKYTVDEFTKTEILKIKNVKAPALYFDIWLDNMDDNVAQMEIKWQSNMSPFLELAINTQRNSELLIARSTGEAAKSSYMLEYNPKTDYICTKDLQSQVNSQQKYILKNIIKDDKLIFPNLIRGYLVALGCILKNILIDDQIYQFNEYLEGGNRNLKENLNSMKILLERVMNADAKLKPRQIIDNGPNCLTKGFTGIPPLPDLSDVYTGRNIRTQFMLDTLTPLHLTKHRFNLHRRSNLMFMKRQPKPLVTPMYERMNGDFLKTPMSYRISCYDRTTQNVNMSIISQQSKPKIIAEYSSGFTLSQITRLLSTKKSSNSKKSKYRPVKHNINVRKGSLFNDSLPYPQVSDSSKFYRSYSSPNLFENKEKISRIGNQFSMVPENCLLEVSDIMTLEKNSFGTPKNVIHIESSGMFLEATSLPVIFVSTPDKFTAAVNVETVNQAHCADLNLSKMQETDRQTEEVNVKTPKNNIQLSKKTSSLEKIINRYKKVQANMQSSNKTEESEFRTIVEEKENFNPINVDVFTANRILLPDLLNPSCNTVMKNSTEILDMKNVVKTTKTRESLGAALGVDEQFLDQFDLID